MYLRYNIKNHYYFYYYYYYYYYYCYYYRIYVSNVSQYICKYDYFYAIK